MKVTLETILERLKEHNCSTDSDAEYATKLVNESLDEEGYLLPFWLKYPEIPIDGIGWRMGVGADYMLINQVYFRCLSNDEQTYYKTKYPKPRPKRDSEL